MRSRSKAFVLGLLLLLAATALAQEAAVIKRTAKVGDVTKFRMKAEATLEGKTAVFTALIVETVTKVEESGDYTLESHSTENKVEFNGNTVEPSETVTTTILKSNGEIVALVTEATDPNLYRVANLNSIRFPTTPLKVGDTWNVEIPKDDRGSAEASGTYKIEAIEKIGEMDAYRITGSLKEKAGELPASMEGTFWVAVADGTLVKMNATLVNAPFPNLAPLTTKISLTREK